MYQRIFGIIFMILLTATACISGVTIILILSPFVALIPLSHISIKLHHILSYFGYRSISTMYQILYGGNFKITIDKNWRIKNGIRGYQDIQKFLKYSSRQNGNAPHHLLVSNHLTYFDWIYLGSLSIILSKEECLLYVAKSQIGRLPIVGWAMNVLSYIFLERNWEKDQSVIDKHLKRIITPHNPTFIGIFPEGTLFSKETNEKSIQYSLKNGLFSPKNVLMPRSLGMRSMVSLHGSSLDGILNVTMGLLPCDSKYPSDVYSFTNFSLCISSPKDICMHLSYIPPEEIPDPANHEKFSNWMNEIFRQKDERLERFYKEKSFVDSDSELIYDGSLFKNGFPLVFLCFIFIFVFWGVVTGYLVFGIVSMLLHI